MNRTRFFDKIRGSLFNGALNQAQISGLQFILDQWNETGFSDRRWLAYALATAYHETAHTMQPIREYGRGREYGRKDPANGQIYYGRGYVQLTWKFNYETASRALGIDFVREPDLVMEPENAAFIMFQGMKDGWFTGRKFGNYLNDHQRDYRNARRIINGTDRAGDLADYALQFEVALDAAHEAAPEPPPITRGVPQHWLVRVFLAIWKVFRP